ncbi:MAG: RNA polymerase subunit sigma [Verrucomicrobia bacterium]|nr:MAG: RNA polymerase subunit sigma [Verrucomicrobiota bacterium]
MDRIDDSNSTRWSLIERLKNWEDNTNWQKFFETYWRLIYRTGIRSGLTDAEAQEVVQETVIAVAKKMRDFKADPAFGSFKGWMLQITRRRIADQLRKRVPEEKPVGRLPQTHTGTDPVEQIPQPAHQQWESLWNEEWRQNLLDAALDAIKEKVSPTQYKIFYLHVVKKMPAGQVSKALKVSIGQVYLAKHRVSATLKKEVRRLEKESGK